MKSDKALWNLKDNCRIWAGWNGFFCVAMFTPGDVHREFLFFLNFQGI